MVQPNKTVGLTAPEILNDLARQYDEPTNDSSAPTKHSSFCDASRRRRIDSSDAEYDRSLGEAANIYRGLLIEVLGIRTVLSSAGADRMRLPVLSRLRSGECGF
jgi:hypothetical protein